MCRTRTFQLHDLNREVLLPHTEDFQIAERGLFRFGMTINLDAEVITLALPEELALSTRRCQSKSYHALVDTLTSETLNRFFDRNCVRLGKLINVTLAG